eukprot:TRINITY_DN15439_c0_g1_i1.p1 TRINITY_DN15439_c0_g1~~TRINITY_DN15439_c0_g1_i1.p1  ORF type:complete len:347 (+),score=20.96 TRINITY_DN15439_c0_g1_i1:76-1041(+)
MTFPRKLVAVMCVLCSAVVNGKAQATRVCDPSRVTYKKFNFKVTMEDGPVFVGDLGVDEAITISCLQITEIPASESCSLPGVAILCRNTYADSSTCTALSEYTYQAVKEVSYGDPNGPDIRWILLWDARANPSQCYPRDVTVTLVYDLESPGGGSAILAAIAIIIVTLLVIVVCIFALSRLVERAKERQEAKDRAMQESEHTTTVVIGSGEMVLCPKCGKGQAKPWEGDDPLMDMRCRNCGKTSHGWTAPQISSKTPGESVPNTAESYQPDTNDDQSLFSSPHECVEKNANPLESQFNSSIKTPTHSATPDAVWNPSPRLS